MNVLIDNNPDGSIPVHDLNDGEIAVITKWAGHANAGIVVQRYKNALVRLGRTSGASWSSDDFWRGRTDLRVRVLPADTVLKLVA